MEDERLSIEDVRQRAAEIGLVDLSHAQLTELLSASNLARAKLRALPIAILSATDEPAHIYTLDVE